MDLDDETRQEIADLLFANRKIEAIKVYRAATGAGLKESKDFLEALQARLHEEDPSRFSPSGQGCGATAVLLVFLFVYVAARCV